MAILIKEKKIRGVCLYCGNTRIYTFSFHGEEKKFFFLGPFSVRIILSFSLVVIGLSLPTLLIELFHIAMLIIIRKGSLSTSERKLKTSSLFISFFEAYVIS